MSDERCEIVVEAPEDSSVAISKTAVGFTTSITHAGGRVDVGYQRVGITPEPQSAESITAHRGTDELES